MQKYPRAVGFGADGKAICAGNPVSVDDRVVTQKVMFLPSDHYDFIGYDVKGKTEAQILAETRLDEIHPAVLKALGDDGLEMTPEEIITLTPQEMFRKYCQWEGLMGSYAPVLWDIVANLMKFKV